MTFLVRPKISHRVPINLISGNNISVWINRQVDFSTLDKMNLLSLPFCPCAPFNSPVMWSACGVVERKMMMLKIDNKHWRNAYECENWGILHIILFLFGHFLFYFRKYHFMVWNSIKCHIFSFERGKAWDFFIDKSIDYIELSWICQVFYRLFFSIEFIENWENNYKKMYN